MEFKKSILILIIAVFLASIAGACASDADDAAMASEDVIELATAENGLKTTEDIEEIDEELLSADDDEIMATENDRDALSANPGNYSGWPRK